MDGSKNISNALKQLFWQGGGGEGKRIYALLDAGRDKAIYPRVMDSGLEKVCLFRGEKAVELAEVAPYLVELQRDDYFTNWLLDAGWGESWGIFAESTKTFKAMRKHFRSFLMVYNEDNDPMFFRYYDPRVLRAFLSVATKDQASVMFDAVDRFWLEGEDKEKITAYKNLKGKLVREEFDIDSL